MCVHIQNKQSFHVCVPMYLVILSIDICAHMLYLYYKQGTKQPGEPKAPDTESHIPVSEQRSNTNSQEDSFGAEIPLN